MPKPKWLEHPCPACHSKAHYACRDEDGLLANPHPERLAASTRPEEKD